MPSCRLTSTGPRVSVHILDNGWRASVADSPARQTIRTRACFADLKSTGYQEHEFSAFCQRHVFAIDHPTGSMPDADAGCIQILRAIMPFYIRSRSGANRRHSPWAIGGYSLGSAAMYVQRMRSSLIQLNHAISAHGQGVKQTTNNNLQSLVLGQSGAAQLTARCIWSAMTCHRFGFLSVLCVLALWQGLPTLTLA